MLSYQIADGQAVTNPLENNRNREVQHGGTKWSCG